MGAKSFLHEVKLKVSPSRMFNALIIFKSPDLLAKVFPYAIKSSGVVGGGPVAVGCTIQTLFVEGTNLNDAKYVLEALDTENLTCKYVVIEGGSLKDKFEKIENEVQHETSSDGGCVIKLKSTYHGKGGAEPEDEDINVDKEASLGFYKGIEDYLVANPNVCV